MPFFVIFFLFDPTVLWLGLDTNTKILLVLFLSTLGQKTKDILSISEQENSHTLTLYVKIEEGIDRLESQR